VYKLKINTESKGLVSHGVSACAGCGLELIIRNVLDVLGEDTIIVIPPGCAALFCGYGNETAIKLAGFQSNLENTAAVAAGVKAGLEIQGNYHTTVLAFAGDGATVDIGIQSLSGMIERGDKVLYICYDNEAYMNTGIQGSSSTPLGASTTTTPGGKQRPRKDLMQIAIAHNIPYAASASLANLNDLKKKVQKAAETDGPSLLHIHCPCPTGWAMLPAKSIEVGKKAVSTGAWVQYEYQGGKLTVNSKLKELEPIEEYLSLQGRFKKLSPKEIADIQKSVRQNYYAVLAKE